MQGRPVLCDYANYKNGQGLHGAPEGGRMKPVVPCVIAALIAVAAIAAFTLVGTRLSTTFSTVGAKL